MKNIFNGVAVKLYLININKWSKIFPYNWNQMCTIEDWSTVVIISFFQGPTAKYNEMKRSMWKISVDVILKIASVKVELIPRWFPKRGDLHSSSTGNSNETVKTQF